MALQRGIHAAIEFAQLRRIFADEMRPEFDDPRSNPARISSAKIRRS